MPTRKPDSITTYLNEAEARELARRLYEAGYRLEGAGPAFRAEGQDVKATRYPTGSLLVQGRATRMFVEQFLKDIVGARYDEPAVGSDEAGKGDYFGPLVVAAVWVDRWAAETLLEEGVQDSKKLSDAAAGRMAVEIEASCPHSVVSIGPQRYNELHDGMRNVNKILAWAHARAIENVLAKRAAGSVITDKFAPDRVVREALMERGRKARLVQKTRAERELPVAAASILARARFLRDLEALEKKFNLRLPKGATHVEEAGRRFVKTHGEEKLRLVAKLHFKTTGRILAGRQLDLEDQWQ